ncbi:TetR/AcrR family transcriptional regulator [Phytoactinopolyspora endophytica]|uniref:TetR/AcrR family transcriptional regulator n=1 Tax=Phytoactinopolyspora endophytica TaxID=1642495 RepID=UPI00101CF443|nr:TetR/AcrR family transcriptional regulator [Phytoactinopolyspora endophytica]
MPGVPTTVIKGRGRQRSFDLARLTPAGEKLLNAASDLFYARGIHAVGVDSIAETAGTTKKTLYDRFGSKDVLVALYLQRRAERWQRFVEEHVAAAEADGDGHGVGVSEKAARRVLVVLHALGEWNSTLSRGCAFVNAFAEIGGDDHPGIAVIRAEKEWTRELYARLLREAGIDDPEIDGLAAQLAMLQEGALMMWTAGGMPDAIDYACDAARRLLSTAAGEKDGGSAP